MTAIQQDAAMSTDMDVNDVENEFLKRITAKPDADKLSDEAEVANDEEDDHEEPEETEADDNSESDEGLDEDESEDEEGTEEADDDEQEEKPESEKKAKVADDEAVTKVKVDGKEIDVKVKDLKRLYGQEKALTQKSQEAASLKKQSEEIGSRHVAGLDAMLKRAQERFEPYSKLDFLVLAKDPNISAEQLSALKDQGQKAWDDVNYLQNGLNQTLKVAEDNRKQQQVKAAQDCITALKDPTTGIPGWSQKVYDDIRTYAIDQGLDRQITDDLVDPAAFKLIHKAMMYDKGKQATTVVKKTDKSPKRILKGTPSNPNKDTNSTNEDARQFQKLRKSGKVDDAEALFLARMK